MIGWSLYNISLKYQIFKVTEYTCISSTLAQSHIFHMDISYYWTLMSFNVIIDDDWMIPV